MIIKYKRINILLKFISGIKGYYSTKLNNYLIIYISENLSAKKKSLILHKCIREFKKPTKK